jgi:hypothetical protein
LHTPSPNQLVLSSQQHKPIQETHELKPESPERRIEKDQGRRSSMEYGCPCNNSWNNKEKRPPLKRGQLKLQIARTLGSLVVPGGAKNSFSFRR